METIKTPVTIDIDALCAAIVSTAGTMSVAQWSLVVGALSDIVRPSELSDDKLAERLSADLDATDKVSADQVGRAIGGKSTLSNVVKLIRRTTPEQLARLSEAAVGTPSAFYSKWSRAFTVKLTTTKVDGNGATFSESDIRALVDSVIEHHVGQMSDSVDDLYAAHKLGKPAQRASSTTKPADDDTPADPAETPETPVKPSDVLPDVRVHELDQPMPIGDDVIAPDDAVALYNAAVDIMQRLIVLQESAKLDKLGTMFGEAAKRVENERVTPLVTSRRKRATAK